jgi:hypothetical protein
MRRWAVATAVTALTSLAVVPAASKTGAETGTRASLEEQGLP